MRPSPWALALFDLIHPTVSLHSSILTTLTMETPHPTYTVHTKRVNIDNLFSSFRDGPLPNQIEPSRVNPVAKVLLAGMLDPTNKSPLSALSVRPELLKNIYHQVEQAWIDDICPCYTEDSLSPSGVTLYDDECIPSDLALVLMDSVAFPSLQDIQCNMLPFITFNTIPS